MGRSRSRSRSPRRDRGERTRPRSRSRSRERDTVGRRRDDRDRDRMERERNDRERVERERQGQGRERNDRDRERIERERHRERDRDRERERPSGSRRRSRSPSPGRWQRGRSPGRRGSSPQSGSSRGRDSMMNERPEIDESLLEGKTDEDIEMMKLMGFCQFDTTKGEQPRNESKKASDGKAVSGDGSCPIDNETQDSNAPMHIEKVNTDTNQVEKPLTTTGENIGRNSSMTNEEEVSRSSMSEEKSKNYRIVTENSQQLKVKPLDIPLPSSPLGGCQPSPSGTDKDNYPVETPKSGKPDLRTHLRRQRHSRSGSLLSLSFGQQSPITGAYRLDSVLSPHPVTPQGMHKKGYCESCFEEGHNQYNCRNPKRCRVCRVLGHYPGGTRCEYYSDGSDIIPFQGQNDILSNFYPCTIKLWNRSFHSTEQAYQYRKAVLLKKPCVAEEIMDQPTARDVKLLAKRCFKPHEGSEDMKVGIMTECLEAKARCLPSYEELLLSTPEETAFAEATTDLFWASGLPRNETKHTQKCGWPGRNVLGNMHKSLAQMLKQRLLKKSAAKQEYEQRKAAAYSPSISPQHLYLPTSLSPDSKLPDARDKQVSHPATSSKPLPRSKSRSRSNSKNRSKSRSKSHSPSRRTSRRSPRKRASSESPDPRSKSRSQSRSSSRSRIRLKSRSKSRSLSPSDKFFIRNKVRFFDGLFHDVEKRVRQVSRHRKMYTDEFVDVWHSQLRKTLYKTGQFMTLCKLKDREKEEKRVEDKDSEVKIEANVVKTGMKRRESTELDGSTKKRKIEVCESVNIVDTPRKVLCQTALNRNVVKRENTNESEDNDLTHELPLQRGPSGIWKVEKMIPRKIDSFSEPSLSKENIDPPVVRRKSVGDEREENFSKCVANVLHFIGSAQETTPAEKNSFKISLGTTDSMMESKNVPNEKETLKDVRKVDIRAKLSKLRAMKDVQSEVPAPKKEYHFSIKSEERETFEAGMSSKSESPVRQIVFKESKNIRGTSSKMPADDDEKKKNKKKARKVSSSSDETDSEGEKGEKRKNNNPGTSSKMPADQKTKKKNKKKAKKDSSSSDETGLEREEEEKRRKRNKSKEKKRRKRSISSSSKSAESDGENRVSKSKGSKRKEKKRKRYTK